MSMADCAKSIGCEWRTFHASLSANADTISRARNAKDARAQTLHDMAIKNIMTAPETFTDQNGTTRIDAAAASWKKTQIDALSKLAGQIDKQFADKRDDTLTVTVSPLQSYLADIQARGSSLPIAKGRTFDNAEIDADI